MEQKAGDAASVAEQKEAETEKMVETAVDVPDALKEVPASQGLALEYEGSQIQDLSAAAGKSPEMLVEAGAADADVLPADDMAASDEIMPFCTDEDYIDECAGKPDAQIISPVLVATGAAGTISHGPVDAPQALAAPDASSESSHAFSNAGPYQQQLVAGG